MHFEFLPIKLIVCYLNAMPQTYKLEAVWIDLTLQCFNLTTVVLSSYTIFELFLLYLAHLPDLLLLKSERRRLSHQYFMDRLLAPDFPKYLRPQPGAVVLTSQGGRSL